MGRARAVSDSTQPRRKPRSGSIEPHGQIQDEFFLHQGSLCKLAERVFTALNAQAAALFLRAGDEKHMVLWAASGSIRAQPGEKVLAIDQGFLKSLLEEKTLVEKVRPRLDAGLLALVPFKPALVLAAPIIVEGEALGFMLALERKSRRCTDLERGLLRLAAEQAASVIEHARLFEQVHAGRERAQALSQQLMEAQEAERRRLAHELHDEVGQALTAVKMNLLAVERTLSDQPARARLDDSVAIVDQALQQVRSLSLDLRPTALDDLGLVAALRWYLDTLAQRSGLGTEFSADFSDLRVSNQLETACFRVAQEALTNVARHAGAKNVRIELCAHPPEFHLTIRDDGVGFDVPAARRRAARGGSLGLLGMQERVFAMGGRIDIVSAPAKGTVVRIMFPMADGPSLERRSRRRAPR
jgi:signal transduction histidine kinase